LSSTAVLTMLDAESKCLGFNVNASLFKPECSRMRCLTKIFVLCARKCEGLTLAAGFELTLLSTL
jgi:hypothetical protein